MKIISGEAKMKINYRQTCILIFLSFLAQKFMTLPGMLYKSCGSMGIFVVISMMLIDILYVFMILNMIEKSNSKTLSEFMKKIVGPVLTKIFCLLLVVSFAITLINMTKEMKFFVVQNLYTEIYWLIVVVPMLAIMSYMIYKGLRNIARVGELICWLVIFGTFYLGLRSVSNVDAGFILPFMKDGIAPLMKGAFDNMTWFGSGTMLLVLFGEIDFSKKKKSLLWKYMLIAISMISFMYFVFYGLFDITAPAHSFAISAVSQFSSLQSSIDELSWIIVSFWIVARFIQLALTGYCVAKCLQYTFSLKSIFMPIMATTLYVFIIAYINEKTVGLENVFSVRAVSIIQFSAQYILPIILFLGYALKRARERNYEKAKNNI